MNEERKQQLLNLLRVVFVIGFAYLYSEGGMHDKWLRRFIAPIELSVGMFIFSRDWRVFLQAPLMMGSLCLGYGADETWVKVFKRTLFGLANGLSSSSYLIYQATKNSHVWFLVSLQNVIVILSCIILGVINPLASARAEEFTIGCLIALLPMMAVRKKE